MRRRSILIVGAGIVGLSVAYFCAKRGASVTVVEAETAGAGASSGNAGFLMPPMPGPIPSPRAIRHGARSIVRRDASPARIAWLIDFWRHCSDDRYRRGLHRTARLAAGAFAAFDELRTDGLAFEMNLEPITFAFADMENARSLVRELEPARRYGYDAPVLLDGAEVRRVEPALSSRVAGGFRLAGTRSVDPASVVSALASGVRALGGVVHEQTAVDALFGTAAGRAGARSGAERTIPDALILCAGSGTGRLAATIGVPLPTRGARGYSLSVPASPLPSGPIALWETKVACAPLQGRLRLTGGLELGATDVRVSERTLRTIVAGARRYVDGIDEARAADRWAGVRPMTPDGLPVIGRVRRFTNLYVATGHAALGVTLGPVTGKHMASLVLDGRAPDEIRPFGFDRARF